MPSICPVLGGLPVITQDGEGGLSRRVVSDPLGTSGSFLWLRLSPLEAGSHSSVLPTAIGSRLSSPVIAVCSLGGKKSVIIYLIGMSARLHSCDKWRSSWWLWRFTRYSGVFWITRASPLCRTASVHLEIRKTHLLEGKPHSLVALVYSDSSYTSCCSVRRAVGLCLSGLVYFFHHFLGCGKCPLRTKLWLCWHQGECTFWAPISTARPGLWQVSLECLCPSSVWPHRL